MGIPYANLINTTICMWEEMNAWFSCALFRCGYITNSRCLMIYVAIFFRVASLEWGQSYMLTSVPMKYPWSMWYIHLDAMHRCCFALMFSKQCILCLSFFRHAQPARVRTWKYVCHYWPFNPLRPRQMAAVFQTTFSNAISWMKMDWSRLKFHWSLFLRVQLTIFQHWFR